MSEPNYITKFFSQNFLAIEMSKTQLLISKPVYLGLPMLELSKTVMYEYWYDYVKPKYSEKANLCYMDTDKFIVNIKINYIAEHVETRFDTLNYELEKQL